MGVEKFIIPESFTLIQSIQLLHHVSLTKYQNYKDTYANYALKNGLLDDHFLNECYKFVQGVTQYIRLGLKLIETQFQVRDIFETLSTAEPVIDLRILKFDIQEESKVLKEKLGKNDLGNLFKKTLGVTSDDKDITSKTHGKITLFSMSSSKDGAPPSESTIVESLKYKRLLHQRQQEMQIQNAELEKREAMKIQLRKEVKKELVRDRINEKVLNKYPEKGFKSAEKKNMAHSLSPKKAIVERPEASAGLNAAILAFAGSSTKPLMPQLKPTTSVKHVSNIPSKKNNVINGKNKTQSSVAPTHRTNNESHIMITDSNALEDPLKDTEIKDTRLKDLQVDAKLISQIMNEILVSDRAILWDDICGLEQTKAVLKETVVYPLLRPDIFKGLREPVTGILLFGPPGTGKTMIGKCVASECKATFFSITSSSLLSKYLGESEKLIKALFLIAKKLAPSIIFIDEIDSLLSSRTGENGENESTRRVKTELLIQWSNIASDQVLVLGATNLPWCIDEAARRRFSKKLYIPLPDHQTRKMQLSKLLVDSTIRPAELEKITQMTEGYSNSDLTTLCKEAAMNPVRELGDRLLRVDLNSVRPISVGDVLKSFEVVKPSSSAQNLKNFEIWSTQYGCTG